MALAIHLDQLTREGKVGKSEIPDCLSADYRIA
jgi:hypothetical protein